ncbi:MAG: hypothetical protein HY543_04960 [Deltaproteobacteria bacterium]|nr:hypothetical protein [Deltaproteobacteria bacterium]
MSQISDESGDDVEDAIEIAYLKDTGRESPSGRRLKMWSTQHHLTCSHVARAAGIHIRYLWKWCGGQRYPKPFTRCRIIWETAHLAGADPTILWHEIHADDSTPQPIPIVVGPDTPVPLAPSVVQLLELLEGTCLFQRARKRRLHGESD